MIKKICFIGIGILLLLGGGFVYGRFYYQPQKSVAFRVSSSQQKVDYDLLAAINYMKYLFKKGGYKVFDERYPGDFYFNEADKADINVFVRAYRPFLDTRLAKDKFNIYYMHRFNNIYNVEFQNFDFYVSSQKLFLEALGDDGHMAYFNGGAIPHKALAPNYQYDMLFIFEYFAPEYGEVVDRIKNKKVYGGIDFARLTEQERMRELAKAKVVVYFSGFFDGDDVDYIPYAVYDIISYGRPVVTNLRLPLRGQFGGDVYLFNTPDEMYQVVTKALQDGDEAREKKALSAREKLFAIQKSNTGIL